MLVAGGVWANHQAEIQAFHMPSGLQVLGGADHSPDYVPFSTQYRCCEQEHVTIGFLTIDATPIIAFDRNRTYTGFVPAFIQALSREMGFTYTLVPAASNPIALIHYTASGAVNLSVKLQCQKGSPPVQSSPWTRLQCLQSSQKRCTPARLSRGRRSCR